ncbi:MAG: amino acid adenylation domain-containing protein [Acidobacteria bacterium]|nr:amino acid adenylation domain-containing protein [Acidobacteriota bacterium]
METKVVEGFRLSPQQRWLWRLREELDGAVDPYRVCSVLQVSGDLDAEVFERAVRTVIQRHEVLRTGFVILAGMSLPLQVIRQKAAPCIRHLDLSDLPPDERAPMAESLFEELRKEPFDVENGPLLHLRRVSFTPGEHLVLAGLSALCADGVALGALLAEIACCYEALAQGRALELEEPTQYVDLSEWQNELLESEDTETGRAYWQKLELPSTDLDLSLLSGDRHCAPFEPRFLRVALPAELSNGLGRQLESLPDCPPAVFLLVCWQVLLWRLTGESELAVAMAFDGRRYEETAKALGVFVKYLPMPCRFGPEQRFEEALAQALISYRAAYKWQEFFEQERSFPIAFECAERPAVFSAGGLGFALLRQEACLDRFELKLSCFRSGATWAAELHYNSSRIGEEDAGRVAARFSALLNGALRSPRTALGELEILPPAEREEVLRDFNDSALDLATDRCLHQLCEEQAVRTPDQVAVVFEDRALSFAELNSRANQLALHLRELGVVPEARVAILAERSLDVVVALLGVLKAGGAYLPLDPAYPRERLAFMVEDAQPQVLITERRLTGLLPPHSLPTVLLDEDGPRIAGRSSALSEGGAVPANLAYVIYTSGSTGRPKGVMVPHRAIVNRLLWMQRTLPLRAGDRVVLKTPLSFDASIWEVFVPLLAGATVVVARPGGHQESAYLVQLIARQEVSVLQLVPSMLRIFLEEPDLSACKRLYRVFSGGEELPVHVKERFFARLDAELHNLYGPTETAIDAAYWQCHPDPAERAVPIGRPIANVRIHLLDPRLSPVPVGVTGELHIAGAGLARGYLGRPDLSAEKLIPNPFALSPGERLYRTGDLARYRPGGAVEFLGRRDHQVKVRGFRIEPGEIEAALQRLPAVAQAVVLVRKIVGDHQLVAYVVPSGEAEPRPNSLRAALHDVLPEHMIPAAFVLLPALPLTPNGKLDRAALPEPELVAEISPTAPRGLAQELLAGIWADVLGRDRVGVHDNFFELGGHSLLATRLVSRVRSAFQVEVSLRRFFDTPTIAGLAAAIEEEQEVPRQLAPPILPVGRDRELPLSFAQQRLWFIDQLRPGSADYNIALPLRIEGRLDLALLVSTLSEVVRRHEVLRTRFPAVEGRGVQVIQPPVAVSPPQIDLSALPASVRDSEAVRLAGEEVARPFDLGRDELLRLTLLRLDKDATAHAALFTLHHIISDGWSTGVLVREVVALYEAFAAGRPSPLPELPIQYADFAVWQREWLSGEVLERQLAYWQARLAGAPAFLDLPTDRPRPALQSNVGSSRPVHFGAPLTGLLAALSRREGVTPFMTLLGAFQTLLCRYSRQTDVVVGTPHAGRNRLELEPLIGFFVNTLAIRTELADGLGFRQLLAGVRATTLDAYVHQDLPFEKLVDELGLERRLSHTPLFQVMFALQNAPVEELSLPGLRVRSMEAGRRTAKFDLTLSLEEQGEELAGGLEYSTELWDAATMDRLLEHLRRLLAGVVEDPEKGVWDLPLLSAAERAELVAWWGPQEVFEPWRECLHERFAEQARRHGESEAVSAGQAEGGSRLSYAELERRASRLARRLRVLGVGPEVLVGLCAERTVELVVGILGILKAGGAYVPLDPSYPLERLRYLLADTAAPVVVAQESLLDRLPVGSQQLVLLEEEAEASGQAGEEEPWPVVLPENPAYVIYTSGSTGRPKGVVVSHRNVSRLFAAAESRFGFGPRDVWTLFHSFAFDFSVWELWGALLYGGRLVVVPYWVSRSPESFRELLVREGVTMLSQTPSAFRQLQRVAGEGELAVRAVVFGGEALEPRSLLPWWEREKARLVNMYGITETTVHVTYRELSGAELGGLPGSVIGRALGDLGLYVLDRRGEPSPVGVAGELHVGGEGLARGYLGRPELTAERFVPNPFVSSPGARLYRTGDLGRYLASGELEYLGRIDAQVKIRGFRIELGEIEAALGSHGSVGESVVLLRGSGEDKRLVAYVTTRVNAPLEPLELESLRTHLRERLPDYMLPAAFVILSALPLTPNGKLDRAALPEPGGERPELGVGYVAPRTRVEEVLAAIWSQVLGLEQVGVHDNFFALGGDSILSLRVMALAGERGLDVALADLFQHQTIAELGASVRLTQGGTEAARSEPFSLISAEDRGKLPEGVEDAYPLAMLQAGMLYHMELTPEDPQYHNVDSWQVRGRFEEEPFAAAVRRVVARHPMLRTAFVLTGYGEPLQLVHRHADLRVTVEDIRHLSSAEQEAAVDRLVAREKLQPFDLTRAPQLRFHVFLRSAETFQFTLAENHAIFDGWSLHSTLAEIFELYFVLLPGASPEPLPPLALTYREYVRLEREALASAAAEEYWRHLLREAELVELPHWPSEWCRPGLRRIGRLSVAVAPEVTAGLKRLAHEVAVPLKSVLLAAHLKVLSLLAGRPDVVSGLVSNGRLEVSEGDQVRGLFLNTLPLRLRLPEGSWADLVRAAFHAEQEMLPHRRYPFGALQRRWGERPIFEIAFNYTHFHVIRDLMRSGDLELLGFQQAEGGNFKLQSTFSQDLEGRGLGLSLEYDSHAVPVALVREIGDEYLRTLMAMARDSRSAHEGASILSPAVRHQLLREWNDSSCALEDSTLHERFACQAESHPDLAAVVCGQEVLTFRALAGRAHRLACSLRALGVGPEEPVALYFERSSAVLVAILGVLEAGGTYLPLDTSYPRERLVSLWENAGRPLVLTERHLASALAVAAPNMLCLDELEAAVPVREVLPSALVHPLGAAGLAYVLHTSGSTGSPKGVCCTHRGVLNLLADFERRQPLAAGSRGSLWTSLSFDVSVYEIFSPLLAGCAVHIVPEEVRQDTDRFLDWLVQERINSAYVPPFMVKALRRRLESAPDAIPLRRLLVGVEPIPEPELARIAELRPGLAVINGYGPAEATICATLHGVDWRQSRFDGASVTPIGRPVANSAVHVLDRSLEPVPVGVPGELYIAGAGVARGYFRRPAATAERFVPNPWNETGGERLYRTGDLARRHPDGKLEFLGRIDHQIKLRGFRIEPAEIEAALLAHPAVREAVVTVLAPAGHASLEGREHRRLVAHVVGVEGGAPSSRELRDFLRERLPSYMVPAAYVSLPALPLTPSGKLDRKALPEPRPEGAVDESAAPRTLTEELLAEIWAQVLGLERVGVEESFFDLGGHSLLATQVTARLREVLEVELPLRVLFQEPTVAGLARWVEEARRSSQGQVAPPIERASREGPLPLSFSQESLWFLDRLHPGGTAYNVPLTVRVTGRLGAPVLARALAAITRRHEILRTTFAVHGDLPIQVILPQPLASLAVVDLADLAPERKEREAHRLATQQMQLPFDLSQGPLLRPVLLRLGEESHVLVVSCHHIIVDGWSMGVFVRELSLLYTAFHTGQPSPLPELPIQYADFAVWQRGWLQGEVLQAGLDHWRQVLTGAPALALATDRPRRAGQSYRAADLRVALPAVVVSPLRALGRQRGATLFMALLSGFAALLERYTGQEDVIVGSPVAGRIRRELEGLIGFFVNTLVLRLDLAGDPAFDSLLGRVRETCITAYDHQDVPFEKLVADLQPTRDLSRSPLFQVLFQSLNTPRGEVVLPGLVLSPVAGEENTAKFELVLNVVETGEGLDLTLRYNAYLFEQATAARLIDHLSTLLAGAAAEPSCPLSDLPLLSEPERGQLLAEVSPHSCLHEIFSARAAAEPTAVALVNGGERLTYGELEARSNQLARFLATRGVHPGVLVGLCLERSVDLVIAILGVLKAGGAYLPLDPDSPAARLEFMVEDSRVPLVLTHTRLRTRLPESAAEVICLDGDGPRVARESTALRAAGATAADLAYVIYTSGSTGRPKGVLISHGNVTRLFSATAPWFGFGSADVWTLFHSYAFDFSVWELWGALLHGGRLVIVPYWVSRSPAEFHALLVNEKVTVLNQTPSAFRQLSWADQEKAPAALSLRLVIFGGEALELQSLASWFERHGDARPLLVNMYGITETTVHVTHREIVQADVQAARGSVIGRPIPDLTLHVLDRRGNLLPVGVPGELYVGGAGLAQGYLARPELTAERFVPDPFSSTPGARLYRSGDLARRLADGDHEYLGRLDHQVKIRGFRIELGEIEAVLAAYPGVREVVVLAREDAENGERRLVAYLGAAAEPDPAGLRAFLAARLPDYMQPAAVVTLPSLPLTTNGKVDRSALPAPETLLVSREGYREPETALEQFLAGLFREALKIERVGVDEDFFALGGNSILGAMLINRLQRELGEIVQVVVIFDCPTVGQLAAYLREQHPAAVARWLPADATTGSGGTADPAGRVDAAMVARMRQLIPPLPALSLPVERNPPALFVLAPPRSGTTLLRIMLGGHPQLFAPPELELLSFPTMADRRAAFAGRDSFWLEGLLRAVKEIRGGEIEEVREWVEDCERREMSTLELYRLLQTELAGRWLVDKTPSYALDPAILRRAEAGFMAPRYLHLSRHPGGMIRSFEEAKIDQIFFRRAHPFTRRQLAELIWEVSHRNILDFLAEVPAGRHHTVRFEELVAAPERVLREVCQFLGLDYHPDMARPYEHGSARMTDGLHSASRMLGDVKFHQHSGVNAEVAERWRSELAEESLGEPARRTADALGYRLDVAKGSHIERGTWDAGELPPLSLAQERFWAGRQLEARTLAPATISIMVRFEGPLDFSCLQRALQEIVDRHEVLRTNFREGTEGPVQVIHPSLPVRLPIIDLARVAPLDRMVEVRAWCRLDSRMHFDYESGPLFRLKLFRFSEKESVLFFVVHHIAFDGWSRTVLEGELAALYNAFREGRPSPLRPLAIQYRDFARWQRRTVTEKSLASDVAFWREHLDGAQPLDLHGDRPRPTRQTFEAGIERVTVSAELEKKLEAFAAAHHVTLFMALLTAFNALLHHETEASDIVTICLFANRNQVEIESLIGNFYAGLPLRTRFSGASTFRELLTRVRDVTLAAQAHPDILYEPVFEGMSFQDREDQGGLATFRIVFQFAKLPPAEQTMSGALRVSPLPFHGSRMRKDLSLFLNQSGRLAGRFRYNRDVLDQERVVRLRDRFLQILAAVVADPDCPVAELLRESAEAAL